MKHINFKPVCFLFVLLSVFQLKSVLGQVTEFDSLEANINGKKQLAETQRRLETKRQQALTTKNDVQYARALFDLVRIRDLRTEDTLYFRNSAFIDSLLAKPASARLVAILHLMQAQRLKMFKYKPKRFNAGAYRTPELKFNYAALSYNQLDSVINHHFEHALSFKEDGKVKEPLLWLSSSPDVFLFVPGFQDIALLEKINHQVERNYGQLSGRVEWLSLPSPAFLSKLDSVVAAKGNGYVLATYRQWLRLHPDNQDEALFIQSLVRKQMFHAMGSDSLARQRYITYLQQCAGTPYEMLKAHAVYQLCLLWNEDGNKYTSWDRQYYGNSTPAFNPRYQFLPARALALYRQHKKLMEKYPVFNRVLDLMEEQITAKRLRIEIGNSHLTGKEIPFRAMYRNTDTMYYRVVRVESLTNYGLINRNNELLVRTPVISGAFALPQPGDNNKHAVYLKLAALPAGKYCLLFDKQRLNAKNTGYINSFTFNVTRIAVINSDQKVFVLDALTGKPLPGASVKAYDKKTKQQLGDSYTISADGHADINQTNADSLHITYNGDTTTHRFMVAGNDGNDDNIYDKEEYDDLLEFFDDKMRVEIFTDRAIYRPGQTVHYKLLFLTYHPATGEVMVFNRANTGGLFNNRVKRWLAANKNRLELKNPFGKVIDSAIININSFGSFAGSFTIPKTAATGEWRLNTEANTDYSNEGEFKVEEYKRPAIELTMEKQKKMLLPGQPFNIKLKLRSFAGAQLGNIPIKYSINRNGSLPDGEGHSYYKTVTLADKTAYTNEQGELSIAVTDTILAATKLNDTLAWHYQYRLNATAVDATGESVDINENVNVSSWPVRINIPIQQTLELQKLPTLLISTSNDFEGPAKHPVHVKIYKTSDPFPRIIQQQTDQWIYSKEDWKEWFPTGAEQQTVSRPKVLVLDTIINTVDNSNFKLPKAVFKAGFYQIIASVEINNRVVGQQKATFSVFDSETGETPVDNFNFLSADIAKPGDLLSWKSASKSPHYAIYHMLYTEGGEKRQVKSIYYTKHEQPGLRNWEFKVPAKAIGQVKITRLAVHNGKLLNYQRVINIPEIIEPAPEIIIEKYRKVMAPGAKETITLSVKTKSSKTAAELLTTLYDATLDKLEKLEWRIPGIGRARNYLHVNWDTPLSFVSYVGDVAADQRLDTNGDNPAYFISADQALQGRVPGISLADAHGLHEVVVLGYGSVKRQDLTGSVTHVTVRGTSSLSDYNQPLIILDGQVYTGNIASINAGSVTHAMVLKGAESAAIYGSRGAQGVLVISTKGPIVLPEPPAPEIKIRKNFNETAFFFPQLHAGLGGYYSFSFTMPETATEWNWKIFAHTRKAKFALLERKLQTQLNLMVQPNMPRLLYQGDRIKLQSRISNLDTLAVNGKATCKIEDAVTGEDITSQLLDSNQQPFSLKGKSSGAVAFMLRVPPGQLNPLKIVLAASTATAADAEEHTLPVLSPKIFIRQSQRIQFAAQPTLSITPIKLPAAATLYGMGISVDQKPQASLINALPWLANYAYDCAEQTFNKMRAQIAALRLMQTDTAAQRSFKSASINISQQQSKVESLPDEMAEIAMPWLGISNRTAQQQKKLFQLLDTITAKAAIENRLERLYKLQQANGGLSWFDGGQSSAYISSYVLAGFGQLKHLGWKPSPGRYQSQQDFIRKLVEYHQDLLLRKGIKRQFDVHILYALSYWQQEHPLNENELHIVQQQLETYWKNINQQSLGEQAMTIINTIRLTKPGTSLNLMARKKLKDIYEMAIQDEQNGMRWKDVADNEELSFSAEETMVLLAEAFSTDGNYKAVQPGVVKWLLTTREDDHWETTKATAAAIHMLQKEKSTAFGQPKEFVANMANKQLAVSDDLLNGKPSAFVALQEKPLQVNLQQTGTNTSGAISWYYFALPEKLDTLNKALRIKKEFYQFDGKAWQPFSGSTTLKAGHKVRVKLTIDAAIRLTFVQISDPRPAAFEPKDNTSGYRYNNGFSYYQSVRDTGLEMFSEAIPKGLSEISYELTVTQSGTFTSGPAHLQCMYKPGITAYSGTDKITVE